MYTLYGYGGDILIKLDEKALNYLKSLDLYLVVNLISQCTGGWAPITTKSLRFETYKNSSDKGHLSKIYEYEGVKIYVHGALKIEDDASINLKFKLPLIGPFWGYKGINI